MNRDALVLSLGPFTLRQLLKHELFPSESAGAQRLAILRDRGLLGIVGYHAEPDFRPGRPENVLCPKTWNPHPKTLGHELIVTELQLIYWQGLWERGYDFGPPYPDGKMLLIDSFYIEADNATERRKKWRKRVKAYEEIEETVLVVTTSGRRMKQLMSWSEGFETACFADLETVAADPWGKVWLDLDEVGHSLQKPPAITPCKNGRISGGVCAEGKTAKSP